MRIEAVHVSYLYQKTKLIYAYLFTLAVSNKKNASEIVRCGVTRLSGKTWRSRLSQRALKTWYPFQTWFTT